MILLIITMLRHISTNSKVVETGTGSNDTVSKVIFICSALIFNNSVSFHATNKMLYSYSDTRYILVKRLFICGQVSAFWLLCWLDNLYAIRSIALVSSILPKGHSVWYRVFLNYPFVMNTPCEGRTDEKEEANQRGYKTILDNMALFLPSVVCFWEFRILRTWNLSFRTIVYQLFDFQFSKKTLKIFITSGWHGLDKFQGLGKNRTQSVSKFVG